MTIDPQTHLFLHRQRQDQRDRHLSHLAAIRSTHDAADVVSATGPPTASPWPHLLRPGRRRTAGGSPTY
jgi:hypothetical protein